MKCRILGHNHSAAFTGLPAAQEGSGTGLNCLVCVKQVPDTDQIKIDPVRHTVIREGVPAIFNPYDAFALETALRLKERHGGCVIALSMGPMQAKTTLEKCLAVGADAAYLVNGRMFSASDTLATSYILSRAAAHIERLLALRFDLILCGKQAIDGDTGQVGPALAEHLRLPQITCAREVQWEAGTLRVQRQISGAEEVLACDGPAVVTMSATPYSLRLPSVRGKLAARKKTIALLDDQALGIDPARCGLAGSPTKVIATEAYVADRHCVMLTGSTGTEYADALARILRDAGVRAEGEA